MTAEHADLDGPGRPYSLTLILPAAAGRTCSRWPGPPRSGDPEALACRWGLHMRDLAAAAADPDAAAG
jgi:hypothetical protein